MEPEKHSIIPHSKMNRIRDGENKSPIEQEEKKDVFAEYVICIECIEIRVLE